MYVDNGLPASTCMRGRRCLTATPIPTSRDSMPFRSEALTNKRCRAPSHTSDIACQSRTSKSAAPLTHVAWSHPPWPHACVARDGGWTPSLEATSSRHHSVAVTFSNRITKNPSLDQRYLPLRLANTFRHTVGPFNGESLFPESSRVSILWQLILGHRPRYSTHRCHRPRQFVLEHDGAVPSR